MRTDSTRLFMQARLEFKASEAFREEGMYAYKLYQKMMQGVDDRYLELLGLGIPACIAAEMAEELRQKALLVYQEAENKFKASKLHRERGEALMAKREKQVRRDLRVRFSG